MDNIEWAIRTYDQMTLDLLFDVLRLRVDVFVVEQQCAYRELEEWDRHQETRHLSGRNAAGQLIAYVRLLPPGLRFSEANLGRLVVKADMRKKGLGHQLLQMALLHLSLCWPNASIRISAQDYLQKFYSQYGFSRVSDVFLEDGILHVEMVKEPR